MAKLTQNQGGYKSLSRLQLVAVILMESLLLYTFISLSIDSGAMWHYGVSILLFVAIVLALLHLFKDFKYKKPNGRKPASKHAKKA